MQITPQEQRTRYDQSAPFHRASHHTAPGYGTSAAAGDFASTNLAHPRPLDAGTTP